MKHDNGQFKVLKKLPLVSICSIMVTDSRYACYELESHKNFYFDILFCPIS